MKEPGCDSSAPGTFSGTVFVGQQHHHLPMASSSPTTQPHFLLMSAFDVFALFASHFLSRVNLSDAINMLLPSSKVDIS
jgi:hypothetical protein